MKIYISAIWYNNIYYILRQSLTNSETIKLLNELSEMAEIADVTKSVIKKSLKTDFKNFENAIQYYCALSLTKIDGIVTLDTKDFKKSTLSVMTSAEAVSSWRPTLPTSLQFLIMQRGSNALLSTLALVKALLYKLLQILLLKQSST